MLEHGLKHQLSNYLRLLTRPVTLSASFDDSFASATLRQLLTEISALSDQLHLVDATAPPQRLPAFSLAADAPPRIHFAGLPMGDTFSAVVLALLHVGGHPPKEAPALLERARQLRGVLHFETYFVQDCKSCPETIQALNLLAALNSNVTHVAIDGAQFPAEMTAREVLKVPKVYLNGDYFCSGWMDVRQVLDTLAPRRSPSASTHEPAQ